MTRSAASDHTGWNDEDYSLLLGAIERLEAAWKAWPGPDLAEFVALPAGDPRRAGMLVRLNDHDRVGGCVVAAQKPEHALLPRHRYQDDNDRQNRNKNAS